MLRLSLQMAEEARRIGARMRERRTELGLTQREAADRLPGHVQAADWSRWEGGRHRPRSDTLQEIATVLETDMADLIAGPLSERATGNGAAHGSPLEDMQAELEDAQNAELARIVTELSAAVEGLVGQLEGLQSGQARLLADVSQVRSELEDQRRLEVHPERGQEGSST